MKNLTLLIIFGLSLSCGTNEREQKIPKPKESSPGLLIYDPSVTVSFHSNGKKKLVGRYDSQKKKTGTWIRYDSTGRVTYKNHYREGLAWKREIYEMGVLDSETVLDTISGKELKTQYYPSGKIRGLLTFIDNVQRENIQYYENGQIKLRMESDQMGYLVGVFQQYFSNGVLAAKVIYGKNQDTTKMFDYSGTLLLTAIGKERIITDTLYSHPQVQKKWFESMKTYGF